MDDNPGVGFTVASSGPVYLHDTAATNCARYDQLSARLGQISAMLMLAQFDIDGEAKPVLNVLRSEDQSYYLWAISTMVDECRELLERGV